MKDKYSVIFYIGGVICGMLVMWFVLTFSSSKSILNISNIGKITELKNISYFSIQYSHKRYEIHTCIKNNKVNMCFTEEGSDLDTLITYVISKYKDYKIVWGEQ